MRPAGVLKSKTFQNKTTKTSVIILNYITLKNDLNKGSENNETEISELEKYISYCTLSHAITITYSLLT